MTAGYPDYEGDKRGLYLQPQWAALRGTDKSFRKSGAALIWGNSVVETYAVPAGKTLYITDIAGAGYASGVGDAELNQIIRVYVAELLGLGIIFDMGGNGGVTHSFAKPIVVRGGYTAQFSVSNFSNHGMIVQVFASGYEV